MNDLPFIIALFDEDDPAGTTVHAFSDLDLWWWVHLPERYPADADAAEVPIPGTDLLAHVSQLDPIVDKAQNLVWLPGQGGRCHPGLTPLGLGPSDTPGFRTAYARLRKAALVVEGRW